MRFRFGDYSLDAGRRELRQGDALVAVEPQVFDLLLYLVQNRDRVVSKDDLLQAIWNGRIVSESTLTSRINAARRAIGDSGAQQGTIRTVARKGFRFVAPVTEDLEAAAREQVQPATPLEARPHPVVPDRPSIAVLPFTNLDGDPQHEYFVDGIVEDIITGLARARWLFVIARNSSFVYKRRACDVRQVAGGLGVRYVLDGSIRKAGERVRIAVQLLDGASGNQVWAQRYDRELSDIFALQDEITETILGAVEPELGKLERKRATTKRPDSVDAWDLYQRGMSHLYQYTKKDLALARQFFRQATEKDPRLGPAYSGLAEAYYYEGVYGFADSISDCREKALAPALRAVALDPEDAGARCTLGRAHYMRRNYEEAIRELRAALQLNPSLALAHYGLGAALVFSGRSQEAVPHLTTAIRLSPYDPNMGSFLVRLADAAFFAGKYEEATEWAQKALQQPNFQWSRYTVLIAALARLGRLEEANRFLQQLKVKRPDISQSFVRETHLFGDAEDLAHYLDALRKAGLTAEENSTEQNAADTHRSTDGRKPSRPPAAGQMRRQVSVLAAEIVTPFQDLQDADAEAGITIINPLVETVRREIERCGGTVLGSADASVVGIFGAGPATEDHAFQACRAALAIKTAVEIGGQTNVRLSIGLDSGETVLRRIGTGDTAQLEAQGAVVRTARRLAQMIRRQAITCTSRMKDALLGFVTTAAMSDADFSGGRPGGTCHEILGQNKVGSRWQLRRARGLTPLTGRVAELGYLNDVWRRVRSGSGQCVGIVGDAGVGKSRLLYEFVTSAAVTECRIVETWALESDALSSFHIVKKLLRTILSIEEGDDAATTAGKVGAYIEALQADASVKAPVLFALDIAPGDREWDSLPAPERVRRVRNAVSVLLALMARARPLIAVVEDLHWVDPESESVLDRLIDGVASKQVLLLLTFRPEYSHAWISRRNYNQFRLDPLPRGEAEALLSALLGDDSSVRASVALIAERTDGVPLFIEETVQALAQSGALTGSPGAYAASSQIASLRVPASIQSVIAARIDQLAASERWLLQTAAIIGRDVSLRILASMAGLDEENAAAGLHELQGAGFLHETQLFPTPVFTFKHALVQEVAYDSLVIADRNALHSRLIDILESTLPHLIDDYVEKLSEHAIGAERWDRAERYLLRSAERALQRSSHNLALSFLHKGLEILVKRPRSSDRDRVELEYQKLVGVAWMAAKGWGAEEVLAAYERAEVLCNELGDERERFVVLRGQAQYYMISRQPRAAQAISLRCAEMTKHLQDEGIAIETHHMFWTNNFFMGECGVAEKHAEDAIALYDPDRHHALTYQYSGHDPGVCSQCFSGLAAWHRGALDRASERCHGALALAERLSHPLTTSLAYWGLGCLGTFRGEPEATLAWAQKQIALCDEYLLPLLRSQGEFQAGWALTQLGDVQAGIAQMEQGVEGIRATGAEMGLPYFLGLLAEALAGIGHRDRALDVLDQATANATRNGAHFLLSEIIRIKAEVLAQLKDRNTQEVEALFRSAVEIATKQNASLPALRAATGWARFLTHHRRRAQARIVLEPYAPLIASLAGSKDAASAAELT